MDTKKSAGEPSSPVACSVCNDTGKVEMPMHLKMLRVFLSSGAKDTLHWDGVSPSELDTVEYLPQCPKCHKLPNAAARSGAVACSAEELYIALREALKLQKHYAELLNMHDGGQRRPEVFASPETWIARLREIGDLPNEKVEFSGRSEASEG